VSIGTGHILLCALSQTASFGILLQQHLLIHLTACCTAFICSSCAILLPMLPNVGAIDWLNNPAPQHIWCGHAALPLTIICKPTVLLTSYKQSRMPKACSNNEQVQHMQPMTWSEHSRVVGHTHTPLHSFLAIHGHLQVSVMPTEYLHFP